MMTLDYFSEKRIDPKQLCLELVKADSEDAVTEILEKNELMNDASMWLPLGNLENNFSIVGNQQSSPTAALVEKLINSIDHMLIKECSKQGIDPESAQAPNAIAEAADRFFGVPEGNLSRLTSAERSTLSNNICLVATGSKDKPCYSIIDQGEGQTPNRMKDTFLSLSSKNKQSIVFVQGRFGMGGSGVLPFCGTKNYELIVSKRNQQLTDPCDDSSSLWGFTIIRREDPSKNVKSSVYKYLAPNGRVPRFPAINLPLLPWEYPKAYAQMMESGTFIKLYEYKLDRPALRTVSTLDLNYELSRKLYALPIPIRILERRSGYVGHTLDAILAGMSVRIEDDRASVLEEGYPTSSIIRVPSLGDLKVTIAVFQPNKAKGERWTTTKEAVFFTINGQTHGALPQSFFRQSEIDLDYIAKDLMVIVDSSGIPGRTREDLFMNSRDRLRDCQEKEELEDALRKALRDHEGLRNLNEKRREAELKTRVMDDRPFEQLLAKLVSDTPLLSELLPRGMIATSRKRGNLDQSLYIGKVFPTYFRLKFQKADFLRMRCPINQLVQILYETDAENQYFNRSDGPGTLEVSCPEAFVSMILWNGTGYLTLKAPSWAKVGVPIPIKVSVSDKSRSKPFCSEIELDIQEPIERSPLTAQEKKKLSGVAFPPIIPVFRNEWDKYDMDATSALELKKHGDTMDVYINMDNIYLFNQKARTTNEAHKMIMEKQFKYGMTLIAFAILYDFRRKKGKLADSEKDESELLEDIKQLSKGIAMVLVPMIRPLSELGDEWNRSLVKD